MSKNRTFIALIIILTISSSISFSQVNTYTPYPRIGIQYSDCFLDQYMIFGLIYKDETGLKANNCIFTINNFPGNSISLIESSILLPAFEKNRQDEEGEKVLPWNFGSEFASIMKNKLLTTSEYAKQELSKSLFIGRSNCVKDTNSYNLGVENITEFSSLRGYNKKLPNRFGAYFSNTYLSMLNEQIKDCGITFGVDLPIRNTETMFNHGFKIGQKG